MQDPQCYAELFFLSWEFALLSPMISQELPWAFHVSSRAIFRGALKY